MKWMTAKEAGELLGIQVTTRRVQVLCDNGQIDDVVRLGKYGQYLEMQQNLLMVGQKPRNSKGIVITANKWRSCENIHWFSLLFVPPARRMEVKMLI